MDKILEGQVLINGIDIWKTYGVFLTEEKQGGRENLNAILTPSKTKDRCGFSRGAWQEILQCAASGERRARRDTSFCTICQDERCLAGQLSFFYSLFESGRARLVAHQLSKLGADTTRLLRGEQFVSRPDLSMERGCTGEPL